MLIKSNQVQATGYKEYLHSESNTRSFLLFGQDVAFAKLPGMSLVICDLTTRASLT
jgi:hypothetical protein